MGRILAMGACIAVLLALGCGDDGPQSSGHSSGSSNPLPEGCRPQQVRALVADLFAAVNGGQRAKALRFISAPSELRGFSVAPQLFAGSGSKTKISRTPAAAYRELFSLARGGGGLSLLAAQVGAPGPLGPQSLSRGRTPLPRQSTAGAEFAISTGSGYGSGKNGIDCRSGSFYLWAMGLSRKLPPQRVCDVRIERHPESLRTNPKLCSY